MSSKAAVIRLRIGAKRSLGVVIGLVMVLSTCLPFAKAMAEQCPEGMSSLDCQALYGPWEDYVPDLGGTCGTDVTSGTTALTGNENAEKAYNFFRGKTSKGNGLSPVQAAAIVGNLMQESHVNPKSTSNGGGTVGIAQWEGDRDDKLKAFATKQGKPFTDLAVQLDYLWQELTTGYQDTLAALQKQTNIEQAVTVFEKGFEGASLPMMTKRIGYAKAALARYGGNSSSDGGSTADTASCDVGGEGGLGINGNFVFPEKTTQAALKNNKGAVWCYTSQKNCHHDYNAADIFNAVGTTNVVAVSGTVLYTKDPGSCDGWRGVPHLQIKGNDGKFYYYTHMQPGSLVVHGGQKVNAGDPIGKIGPTSCAQGTSPHLHFQMSSVEVNNTSSAAERSHYINPQPNLVNAFAKLPGN